MRSPVFAAIVAITTFMASCASSSTPSQFDAASYSCPDVLTADVVVLGGGSSGAYGAIALKDAGKSVIVVEKNNYLGGHFETYTDSHTGTPVDYGVQLVWNTTVVRNFFARFSIPIANYSVPTVPTVIADFTTGQNVSGVQTTSSFAGYAAQVRRYPAVPYGTDFKNPPPADFALPFGQFAIKYGIQSEAYAIYNIPACTGLGNILNQPTLSIFRCLNQITFAEGEGAAIVTANGNFSQLFTRVQAELGANALLQSTVVAALRPANTGGSDLSALVVQTPAGRKLVLARQILVAYPQDATNMQPLGLDAREAAVFPNFTYNAWYTGLVQNTGLAEAYYLNAGAHTLYHIPHLPGIYHIAPTAVPRLYNFWYGADAPVAQSQVEAELFATIAKLTGHTQQPQIVAYSNHTPYNLHFDAADLEAGLYAQFDALQSYRNTWYTGAVRALPSGQLWATTQSIVQQIVATLGAS